VQAVVIDERELEAFRQTLPDYRQHEYYRFLWLYWDVVKGLYLVQRYPRPLDRLQVADAARAYGFEQALEDGSMGLFSIDVQAAMSEQVDLGRPVLLARVRLKERGKLHLLLIDGMHRLYKATRQSRETLPCFVLTPAEEMLCRC